MSAFEDDLETCFDDWDTFSYTEKAYPHKSSKTKSLNGVFGYDYVDIANTTTNAPTMNTKASHFSNLQQGDNITLDDCVLDSTQNEKIFKVIDWQNGAMGDITLILEEQ